MSKDVFAVIVECPSGSVDEFLAAFEWSLSRVTDAKNDFLGNGFGFTGRFVVDSNIKASVEDIETVIREQLCEFMDQYTNIKVIQTTEWS